MSRPVIDERRRQARRQFLEAYGLGREPDNRLLIEAEKEFGRLPFTTHDLYDLYLVDFIKTLPREFSEPIKLRGGMMRNMAQAHACASAHMMMLVYIITKADIYEKAR
jgi:hypothetical protein